MMIKKAVVIAIEPMPNYMPVEMIPLIDKPTIQYVIEEIVHAGIKEILIVLGNNKDSIIKHFEEYSCFDYDTSSLNVGDATIYFTKCTNEVDFKGAVMTSKRFVGDEPFVLLSASHVFMHTAEGVTKLIGESYTYLNHSVLAVQKDRVADSQVLITDEEDGYLAVKNVKIGYIKESPLSLCGRFALRPEIFIYLEKSKGFIDALDRMAKDLKIYAIQVDHDRYDVSTKSGYVKSIIDMALGRTDMREEITRHMEQYIKPALD